MNDSNIYSKLNILNNNQRQIYMHYIDDLEKLPKNDFQRLHFKLINILYDYQTTKVDIDIEQIRIHYAMSNFPSYAVDENAVMKEVERLENAPYKNYKKEITSFEKELNLAKARLLKEKDKIFDKILKVYVDFTLSEEKSYQDFYNQIDQICNDNDIIKLDTYLK